MKKIFFTLCFIIPAYSLNAQVLYGITQKGGNSNSGTIFKLDGATNTLTSVFSFGAGDGGFPLGSLIQVADGKLYGMTSSRGSGDYGVIFSYDPSTATYAKLVELEGTNGGYPDGSLVQATDGKLYGMTRSGGSSNYGVIFSYDPSTAIYTNLKDFDNTNGSYPYGGSLVQASNGKLYGMTNSGGSNNLGVIFSYDPTTSTYAKLVDFDGTKGGAPFGSLMQAIDGKLYGMNYARGSHSVGVIFSYDPSTDTYTKLIDFDPPTGGAPFGTFVQASDGKLYGMTSYSQSTGNGTIFSYDPSTGTYAKLKDFDGPNGRNPYGSLMQASNGKLYGMASSGGSKDYGVSFSFDPSTLTYTKLADFTGSNGQNPYYTSFVEICTTTTYYQDADGDGFGNAAVTTTACPSAALPTGYVANSSDCDDNDNTEWQSATLSIDADGDGYDAGTAKVCYGTSMPAGFTATTNGSDCNDADATVHAPVQYYVDADHDGYGSTATAMLCSSAAPVGYSTNNTDCNDREAGIHQAKQYYVDADHDGYGSTATVMLCSSRAPVCYSTVNTDCNDKDAGIHRAKQYYVDADHDGYGSTATVMLCCSKAPVGYSTNKKDCNDRDAGIHQPKQYYVDADHDGYGSTKTVMVCCSKAPVGYSTNNKDCNDRDAGIHEPKQYYVDADHDGYGSTKTAMLCTSAAPVGYSTNKRDCNDKDATIHPNASEICDGKDNNCNGQTDEGCPVSISLSITDASATEGDKGSGIMKFTVTPNKISNQTVTVNYAIKGITAMAGSDYVTCLGTLKFLPGVKTQAIPVSIIGDKTIESNETFNVVLSNPVNATIAKGTATGTIINDDKKAMARAGGSENTAISNNSILLFPNPASAKVNISLTDYTGTVTIELSSLDGRLLQDDKLQVSSLKIAKQAMDISRYAAGVYFVTIVDEKGSRKTEKLVIAQ